MKIAIDGVGAWGPGFADWPSLRHLLSNGSDAPLEPAAAPKPALIPARERRRAPPLIRLAVEVAAQACDDAGVDPADVASVFASAMADMSITDYMCRTLAAGHRELSPTRFHNSVHNAASGYWSISTGCHAAATSVAGYRDTVPVALLEAATQCLVDNRPILLVAFDVPGPQPVDLTPISGSFGAALLLRPDQGRHVLRLNVDAAPASWPALGAACLHELYDTNPSARLLALLDMLQRPDHGKVVCPLGAAASLSVESRLAEKAA